MMDFLKSIAPTVASALLGPFGGVAVAALGEIFGVEEPTVEKVTKLFQDGKLTPEHLMRLKELELKFKNDEAERGFKYAELEFKNVQGAREMQMQTKSDFPAILSSVVTVGFFAILGFMFKYPEVKESAPLMIMLGSLGAAFGAVVNFWLGSAHQPQLPVRYRVGDK